MIVEGMCFFPAAVVHLKAKGDSKEGRGSCFPFPTLQPPFWGLTMNLGYGQVHFCSCGGELPLRAKDSSSHPWATFVHANHSFYTSFSFCVGFVKRSAKGAQLKCTKAEINSVEFSGFPEGRSDG